MYCHGLLYLLIQWQYRTCILYQQPLMWGKETPQPILVPFSHRYSLMTLLVHVQSLQQGQSQFPLDGHITDQAVCGQVEFPLNIPQLSTGWIGLQNGYKLLVSLRRYCKTGYLSRNHRTSCTASWTLIGNWWFRGWLSGGGHWGSSEDTTVTARMRISRTNSVSHVVHPSQLPAEGKQVLASTICPCTSMAQHMLPVLAGPCSQQGPYDHRCIVQQVQVQVRWDGYIAFYVMVKCRDGLMDKEMTAGNLSLQYSRFWKFSKRADSTSWKSCKDRN